MFFVWLISGKLGHCNMLLRNLKSSDVLCRLSLCGLYGPMPSPSITMGANGIPKQTLIPEVEKITDYERQKCQTFAKFQDTHLSLERHHNEWHLRRRSSCLFEEAFKHTCYINRVKTRRNMYVIWLSHLNLPQIGYVPRFISEIHRTLMASHDIWSPKRGRNRPSTCLPICPGRNPPRRTRRWRQVIT